MSNGSRLQIGGGDRLRDRLREVGGVAGVLEHRNQTLRLHVVHPLEQGMLFGSPQPQFGPPFAGMLGEELHHRFLPP